MPTPDDNSSGGDDSVLIVYERLTQDDSADSRVIADSVAATQEVVCLHDSGEVSNPLGNSACVSPDGECDVSIEYISVQSTSGGNNSRRNSRRSGSVISRRVYFAPHSRLSGGSARRLSAGVSSPRVKLDKQLRASKRCRNKLNKLLRRQISKFDSQLKRVSMMGRRIRKKPTKCASFRPAYSQLYRSRRKRPIIIDGANVAFAHGCGKFSVPGIELTLNYFERLGHTCTVFLSSSFLDKIPNIEQKLRRMRSEARVIFTPARNIDGRTFTCYDDRYIVMRAVETSGVIVSRDKFRDIAQENEEWAHVINNRLLIPVFIGDSLMLPPDPLGRCGPPLEMFLTFPPSDNVVETVVL